MKGAPNRSMIRVPDTLYLSLPEREALEARLRKGDFTTLSVLRGLVALAGSEVEVFAVGPRRYVVTSRLSAPEDMAPLAIYDASARVRMAYPIAKAAGAQLRMAPVPPIDYSPPDGEFP